MTSPTQLTLKNLRDRGYKTVQVVEVWNPHAFKRQDLFGIIDVLAVGHGETVAVQCTTKGHLKDRIRKIADSDAIGDIREAGWKVLGHGWHQPKGPRTRWQLVEEDLS